MKNYHYIGTMEGIKNATAKRMLMDDNLDMYPAKSLRPRENNGTYYLDVGYHPDIMTLVYSKAADRDQDLELLSLYLD